MHIRQKNEYGNNIEAKQLVLEIDILLKKTIKINKAPVPEPGKQYHRHFIGKKQVVGEGVSYKVDKLCSCLVHLKPVGITDRSCIV